MAPRRSIGSRDLPLMFCHGVTESTVSCESSAARGMPITALAEVRAYVALTPAQSDSVLRGEEVAGTWRHRWGLRPSAELAPWLELEMFRGVVASRHVETETPALEPKP